MKCSDVEDERLKLHCQVVRGQAADATEEACGSQAVVSSCGGQVDGGAGKVGPRRKWKRTERTDWPAAGRRPACPLGVGVDGGRRTAMQGGMCYL